MQTHLYMNIGDFLMSTVRWISLCNRNSLNIAWIPCSNNSPMNRRVGDWSSGSHAASRVCLKARPASCNYPLFGESCLLIFLFSLETVKKICGYTADICALLWTGTMLIGYVFCTVVCSSVLTEIVRCSGLKWLLCSKMLTAYSSGSKMVKYP